MRNTAFVLLYYTHIFITNISLKHTLFRIKKHN